MNLANVKVNYFGVSDSVCGLYHFFPSLQLPSDTANKNSNKSILLLIIVEYLMEETRIFKL